MKTTYLDYASTTNIRKEVYEAMEPYLKERFYNPSSLYDEGINNKKVINRCRKTIAKYINAKHSEIYFTSGGSEANNWAMKGIAFSNRTKKEIITTKMEHHSLLYSCEFLERMGFTVHYLDVDKEGFIDLNQLESLINTNTLLVSIMMANNEIGTIQDIKAIANLCHTYDVLLHTDAIQAMTHIPIDVKELGIDLMSVSGHKFHAPKGVGFLYIRDGIQIENLIHGGGQEYGKRAGTENLAYIVGLEKAVELEMGELHQNDTKQRKLATLLLKLIGEKINDVILNGPEIGKRRLPGNVNISFKNVDNSVLSYILNTKGIYIATGSACDSNSIEPSHVIKAINVPEEYQKGTIRITLGKDTTEEDIIYISQVITTLILNKEV